MIGVDYELFWTLNPKTLSPFIKAFSLRQRYEDFLAWQSGKYIQFAIASTLSKDSKYPKESFLYKQELEVKVLTEEEKRKREQDKIKRKFMEQMIKINSRIGKE